MAFFGKLKAAAIASGLTWKDILDAFNTELTLAVNGDSDPLITGLQITFPQIVNPQLLIGEDVRAISSVVTIGGPAFLALPAPKIQFGGVVSQRTFDGQLISVDRVMLFVPLESPEQLFDPAYGAYIQLERKRTAKATRRKSKWVVPMPGSHNESGAGEIPDRQTQWPLAGTRSGDLHGPVELATYRKTIYPFIVDQQQMDKPVFGVVGDGRSGPARGTAEVRKTWGCNRLDQYIRFRVVLTNPGTNHKVLGPPSEVLHVAPFPYSLTRLSDNSVRYSPLNKLSAKLR